MLEMDSPATSPTNSTNALTLLSECGAVTATVKVLLELLEGRPTSSCGPSCWYYVKLPAGGYEEVEEK